MQRFFRSSIGVNIGLTLGRIIPLKFGYTLTAIGAKIMARNQNSAMVQALQLNQEVVQGVNPTSDQMRQIVESVFRHAGRCFVDLYHNIQNPIGLKGLSPLNPALERLIIQSQDSSMGAFIVAPHLSNFDLILLAAAYRGLKAQVLTFGNPEGGYKIQNEIRAQTGLNITPVSPEIHRQAVENMKHGGFVVTAVDRPIRRKALKLNFFGRPSPLPAGHIRMALEADVPIIVVAAEMKSDGCYHVNISDPIELIRNNDPDKEIRINAEAVLQILESHIRNNPDQWLMYYPVWPDAARKNPA
jgi:KDO2-lipid IV(A) lauroyltransferase